MLPLSSVSAIMPVGYGSKYFLVALDCFLRQNYPGSLELIILDNSDEPIEPLLPESASTESIVLIHYAQCERMPVGALRNLGTSLASGEVCITWDEDDWSSSDRVMSQVERLIDTGKAVTGWHNILFWDMSSERGYKYFNEPSGRNHPPYACGTSQCYLKSWWEKHPFPSTGVEDWPFTQEAMHAGQLDSCDASQLCVARAHKDSKCPPQLGTHKQFPAVERNAFPQSFFDAIGFEKQ